MTPGRSSLVFAAAALMAVLGPAPAAAEPATRQAQVDAWRLSEEPAADGGAVVRLRRTDAAVELEIHVTIWRGNSGQLRGAALRLRDCSTGERDALIDPDAETSPAEMRSLVQTNLEECHVSATEAAALLAGSEPAFAQFEAWRRETAARLASAPPVADRGVPMDEGRGIRNCAGLRGVLRDPSGEGRDMYRTPEERGEPIGRIADGAAFEIRATFNGWLEVAVPGAADAAEWILGWGVTVESASAQAYAFPRGSSQVLLRSRDGRPLAAHGALEDVIACDGDWVFGRWRLDAPDQIDRIAEIHVWTDPVRVEAWTPHPVTTGGPPARPDVRRPVGDWLVESVAEEELSRLTRLSRTGDDFTITWEASFWHGNSGPYFGARVVRPGRACGSGEWRRDPDGNVWRPEGDVAAAARDLRERLAGYFAECGTAPAEIEAALDGLEPAFALAAEWAEADRRLVLAVADWIVNDSVSAPPDRESEQMVAGWRVYSVTRSDRSSAIQFGRGLGETSFEYVMALYPEAPGTQSWSIRRGRCGEADGAVLTDLPAPAEVRARFAALLAACAIPAAESEAALDGLEPAFALAAELARAATAGAGGAPR